MGFHLKLSNQICNFLAMNFRWRIEFKTHLEVNPNLAQQRKCTKFDKPVQWTAEPTIEVHSIPLQSWVGVRKSSAVRGWKMDSI